MTLGWRAFVVIRHGFLLAFMCTTAATASTPAVNFLGIAPQDVSYYNSGILLWCKDGSKRFSIDRLNDDFCDCPDGTDEPGTSACPNGRFYCRNQKQAPLWVFSSRVNDGICDCCDGSDEYDGIVQCRYRCTVEDNGALIQDVPTKGAREVVVTANKRKAWPLDKKENELADVTFSKSYFLRILELLELVLVIMALWQFYSWTFHRGFGLRRRLPR